MFLVYLNKNGKLITHPVTYNGQTYKYDEIDEPHIISGLYINQKKYILPNLTDIEVYCNLEILVNMDFLQKSHFVKTGAKKTFTKSELVQLYPAEFLIGEIAAPTLNEVIQDTFNTGETGNYTLKGSDFTRDMLISIEGQTINYVTWVNSTEVLVNVTNGVVDGNFDVTLDNGTEVVFADMVLINQGQVLVPEIADFSNVNLMIVGSGESAIQTYNSIGTSEWNLPFDFNKDFELRFKMRKSALGIPLDEALSNFALHKVSDNTRIVGTRFGDDDIDIKTHLYDLDALIQNVYIISDTPENEEIFFNYEFKFRYVAGVMYYYVNGVLKYTLANAVIDSNMYLKISSRSIDHHSIKYIELL